MKCEVVTVKERTKVVTLYHLSDLLVLVIGAAVLVGLIVGLIAYRAGEQSVCEKAGLVRVDTTTFGGTWEYAPTTKAYVPAKREAGK